MKMKRQEENEQQESQADKPQTTALIPQVGREHELKLTKGFHVVKEGFPASHSVRPAATTLGSDW